MHTYHVTPSQLRGPGQQDGFNGEETAVTQYYEMSKCLKKEKKLRTSYPASKDEERKTHEDGGTQEKNRPVNII